MNPQERRRITWGPGTHANLDPFLVDVFGRVFNANTSNPPIAIDRPTAIRMWRERGDGNEWHALEASEPRGQGEKLPSVTSAELLGRSADIFVDRMSGESTESQQTVARWLFTLRDNGEEGVWSDRDAPPPVRMLDLPPEWLPLAGDPRPHATTQQMLKKRPRQDDRGGGLNGWLPASG